MHEIPLPHGTMTRFPAVGVKKNALILCPGGGYEHCSIREGAPAAALYGSQAANGVILITIKKAAPRNGSP